MRNPVIALVALAAVGVGAAPANADITLAVPVNVSNIHPNVKTVSLYCEMCAGVCTRPANAPPDSMSSNSIGFTNIAVTLQANRSHTGTVNVVLAAMPPKTDANGTDYSCRLILTGPANASYMVGASNPPPWAQVQSGAPLTGQQSGKLH